MSEKIEVSVQVSKTDDFKKELAVLLNCYGWDTACDTPDYILATYLDNMLNDYCAVMARNIAWHTDWKRLGDKIPKTVVGEECEHLCDRCGCEYCQDRDVFKPITKCRGFSEKGTKNESDCKD